MVQVTRDCRVGSIARGTGQAVIRRWMLLLAAGTVAFCLALTGCGGSGVETAPVSGKVTLDGQPEGDIMVNFQPTGDTTGIGSAGLTSADGTFSLKTVGEKSQEGAVVGTHTVTLFPKVPDEDPMDDYPLPDLDDLRIPLPPKAFDGSLTFEVPPEGTDSANFDLESRN